MEHQPIQTVRAYPPRLMGVEDAAYYVGISPTYLRQHGPAPKHLGKRRLYDRNDLDRWADRLNGQPLDDVEDQAEAKDVERRFLENRRGHG